MGSPITVRELAGIAEMSAASRLWDSIWSRSEPGHEIDPGMMVAIAHAGGYLSAALDGDTMIGACLGFWGSPGYGALHSHITGVLPAYAGQGVGALIKNHQREWCLAQGGVAITWTFDPLVSRNAHFNINRLGARPERYLPDVYGALHDDLNRGDASDRLLVRWSLTEPAPGSATPGPAQPGSAQPGSAQPGSARPTVPLVADRDGEPVVGVALDELDGTTGLTVAVPDDITALRRADPRAAALWRAAVREALVSLLDRGWSITGFERGRGYRVEAPAGADWTPA